MKIVASTVLVSLSLIAGAASAATTASADKTRAQVVAELQDAQSRATQPYTDNQYPVIISTSSKSRQQVQEELEAARTAGLLDVTDSQYPRIQNANSSKTRAEVKAELAEYQTAHANAYIAG